MYKSLFRIWVLIFLNLFAFMLFWTILGAVFWNKSDFLLWTVLISIIPLMFIMFFEIKKLNIELSNISKIKKYERNTKWKKN